MAKIEGPCREVCEATEFVTIVTTGDDGPPRKVHGTRTPGQGCLITGTGEIVTSGEIVDAVKAKFPWARGALVVKVEKTQLQL